MGSYVAENGDMDEEISQRIKSAWYNGKKISGVSCDKRISARLKGKVYKSVALLYNSETWPMKTHKRKEWSGRNEDVAIDVWSDKVR